LFQLSDPDSTPDNQAALVLKELFAFSQESLSEILEVPPPQVQDRLDSARRALLEIFYRRCRLVSEQGPCHQCDFLNWYYNPQAPRRLSTNFFQTADATAQATVDFLNPLLEMVKSVDLIRESSRPLHRFLYDLIDFREDGDSIVFTSR
jgi:hypothetical protein